MSTESDLPSALVRTDPEGKVERNQPPTLLERMSKTWEKTKQEIDALGRWRVVIVAALALGAALAFIAFLGTESRPAPQQLDELKDRPTPTPEARKNLFDLLADPSILKDPGVQRFILGFAALALAVVLLAFTYDVGKIRLSAQSLAHRRNVMFAFSIVLLTEIFAVNIGETLGIVTNDKPKAPVEVDSFANGILGFFLIYSFVEYSFTFASDYIRSRADWKTNDGVVQGSAVLLIGIYRVLFDILLPTLALAYVLMFFSKETIDFASMAKDAIACKRPTLEADPMESIEWAKSKLDEFEARYPDAKHAIADMRLAIEATENTAELNKSSSWFACSRRG
ncbi:MAG: hypothetical protein MUE84_02815 [Hyphomonas sp.]|jgi:hypothetical protein|nr:hypothetical protein [Hyphomonas sp.]